jgi:hypothetical protein
MSLLRIVLQVFNFFKPDYFPPGSIGRAGLVAPEAELATTPYLIGLMNGLRSLVSSGLTACNNGLGSHYSVARYQASDLFQQDCGAAELKVDGRLEFMPTGTDASTIVHELDLLLTGGRLGESTKSIIVSEVSEVLSRSTGYMVSVMGGIDGGPSFCAEATQERHEVVCCATSREIDWSIGFDETTVGRGAYYDSLSRSETCLDYTTAHPSADNNDGTALYASAFILDEDVPRTDPDSVDERSAVDWIDPLADDGGFTGNLAYSCLHSRVYAVAEAGCAADGARICTQGEIEAECAKGVGCGHNSDHVWSSTPCTLDSSSEALKLAIELVLGTAEFHSTNDNRMTEEVRTPRQEIESQGRPYKATVLLYMDGGLDSFNLLVPHSSCEAAAEGVDMYEHYKAVRGETLALPKDSLLQVTVSPSGSAPPCDVWGIHPSLPVLQTLFEEGDASFVANIGSLIEPLTLDEYKLGVKRIPTQLFSHNTQTKQAQSVHPQFSASKGVLGRLGDALKTQSSAYRTHAYSISGNMKAVEAEDAAIMIDKRMGVTRFSGTATVGPAYHRLSERKAASLFGDTWGSLLSEALDGTERLGDILDSAVVTTEFPGDEELSMQLKQVARLISARGATEAEREVYVVKLGGFEYALPPRPPLPCVPSSHVHAVAMLPRTVPRLTSV